jgi:dihydroorotate dehydrogenase (NAD+) catalytic subunit
MVLIMGKSSYYSIYDIDKTLEENLDLGPNPDYVSNITSSNPPGSYTFVGLPVNAPFGAGAAPTGTDSRFMRVMFDAGYDIVTSKTRRSVHYQPNNFPNVVHIIPGKIGSGQQFSELTNRTTAASSDYATLTLANSYGNNSVDPVYWLPDAKVANSLPDKGQLLITNIIGTIQPGFDTEDYYRDFAHTAKLAKDSGARVIEINLLCPHVDNRGVICYDPAAVHEICSLVRHAVGATPLIAKIGYFPQIEESLLQSVLAAAEPYVQAVSAINTFAAPIYNPDGSQAMPGKGRLKAGISGHAVKDIGIDMVRRLAAMRAHEGWDFDIVGLGGVLEAKDFHAYRRAGADIVLSATGAMWNPNLAHEIKNSLKNE